MSETYSNINENFFKTIKTFVFIDILLSLAC